MKKHVLLICLLAVLFVVGCTVQTPDTSETQEEMPEVQEETLEPIKVGAIAPLTGDVAVVGTPIVNAVQLAVDQS